MMNYVVRSILPGAAIPCQGLSSMSFHPLSSISHLHSPQRCCIGKLPKHEEETKLWWWAQPTNINICRKALFSNANTIFSVVPCCDLLHGCLLVECCLGLCTHSLPLCPTGSISISSSGWLTESVCEVTSMITKRHNSVNCVGRSSALCPIYIQYDPSAPPQSSGARTRHLQSWAS